MLTQPDTGEGIERRRFMKLGIVAAGGMFFVACSPSPVETPPTPTALILPTKAPPTPTVPPKPKLSADISFAASSGAIGPQMLPLLVAQELFLKEEGINQRIAPYQSGGETVRAIVAGGQQIGHPTANAVAIAVSQDQPIRIIAENLPFASVAWAAKADSPTQSMKDLKGKKLGYSRTGSISQTYALAALRSLGFAPDEDVKMIAAGSAPEQLGAILSGTVDVGWLTDPLLTEELLKNTVRVIGRSHDFLPAWSESMLATSVEYAISNREVLVAYLRAHQKSMDFIRSNPDRAAAIWARGQDITVEVARAALRNYPLEKLTSRIDPAALKAISDDMLANRQMKEAPDWRMIVDQSFLDPELRTEI